MESGRIEPFRLFPYIGRHSPASSTPSGQIYTMYIDFPLDGNTPNPTLKSLKRRLGLENPLQTPRRPRPPWRLWRPGAAWPLTWRPLEAPLRRPWRPWTPLKGLDSRHPPRLWRFLRVQGPSRPLQAPGGPWRPPPLVRDIWASGSSSEGPGGSWRPGCWDRLGTPQNLA